MKLGLVAVSCLVACGDNGRAPAPLFEDPDVEVGCRPGPVIGTRAKVVACSGELIGGRLAAGRIGDFVLENAYLRVIVRGPGQGFYLHGTSGGGLVDAAAIGGEDLVKEILPAIDLSAGGFEEFVIVEAGDDGPAELVVRGPAVGVDIVQAAVSREIPNVIVEHHYRLAADAKELELVTKVFPQDGNFVAHELHDLMFLGGRAPAFLPGKGFDSGAAGAEVIATSGTTTSYGLVYPVGAQDPQLIDLAGIRLVAGPDTDAGGTRRFLIVGDGTIASVTERAWQLRGQELGEIIGSTIPGADLVVSQAGAPLTIGRSGPGGQFRIAVPFGEYTVRAQGLGLETTAEIAVTADPSVVASLPPPRFGTIGLSVRDDTDHPIPARVVLTLDGGGDERMEWIDSSGLGSFRVPPGTWSVSVSRGLEYDAFTANQVVIADNQSQLLVVTLAHVVNTDGWISLDTHLHSELSTDSTFPIDDRLKAVAGEGVDVAVATDHDIVVDYAPIIQELGLGGWMGSMVGCETSSLVFGHVNGFPLALDPARTGGGGVRWHKKSPTEVFSGLRAGGNRIVQANHPRDGNSSLFNALDLDPVTLEVGRDPVSLGLPANTDLSDLGFDAVEVANGSRNDDFEEVFEDFLAMVAAGHPACATGSSDSHGASRFAGTARTFVFVGPGNDDPVLLDPDAIVAAIKARHVVVGTGAFVTAGIVKNAVTSLPGDTVNITGDAEVTLRVKVQAASWQPTARIRVFQGRSEVRTFDLDPDDTAPVRFDQDIVLPAPAASTFWVVRVDMGGRGDPVLGESMPSFTNPMFGHID